jgi:hypothetical protein
MKNLVKIEYWADLGFFEKTREILDKQGFKVLGESLRISLPDSMRKKHDR